MEARTREVLRRKLWPLWAIRLLLLRNDSYLHTTGWLESLKRGYPCREGGMATPWMNYPVVNFLEDRLQSDFTLFEYGSGSSTYFFAKLVAGIVSVESDPSWFEHLAKSPPENVELLYREPDVGGAYCRAIYAQNQPYDVVLVDGEDRVNCLKQSVGALSDRGVIILDDSHRKDYHEGVRFVHDSGFSTLDIAGLKPMGYEMDQTTIFYRAKNCLAI